MATWSVVRKMICAVGTHLETLSRLALLLVDDPEPEEDLVGLLEAWERGGVRGGADARLGVLTGIHSNNTRECLLCVLETAVTIVENTDTVPQLGLLCDNRA